MRIEVRPIDSVTPYDHNPRKNDHVVEAVARSIREFGFTLIPLVIAERREEGGPAGK